MHVQTVPDTTALLDSGSMTAVPRETHPAAKKRHKIGISALPLELGNGSTNNNTAAGEQLCILMLQLTFSGTPCPFKWNIFSESIRNLADAILHYNDWDPANLHAACQHLVPPLHLLDDTIPFAVSLEQVVHNPIEPHGTSNIYINNFIQVTIHLDNTNNSFWCEQVTLLAIDCCSRPKHPHKPIQREDMEAHNKLSAKAGLEEEKIVLGWKLNTQWLIVSLPTNKFVAWTNIINSTLEAGTAVPITSV
jgi:hypothetical protein